MNGLLWDSPFKQNLGKREACNMKQLVNKARPFINLEEKLNNRFENLVVANTNFGRLTWKDSHWRKDESDHGMHGRYD